VVCYKLSICESFLCIATCPSSEVTPRRRLIETIYIDEIGRHSDWSAWTVDRSIAMPGPTLDNRTGKTADTIFPRAGFVLTIQVLEQ
jgi:hypothetical protein